MKTDIIISTTNSIDGATIVKYLDIVSTNVVVGTNFFSDFGASLSDLFGGLSDTYQSKLQKIYKIGIQKIKIKASNLGANAILGLNIDFDEISGKGKSMFMISAIGTAVRLQFKEEISTVQKQSDSIIDMDTLNHEITKRLIINKLNDKILPSQDDWIFLMNTPIIDISKTLLEFYFERLKKPQIDRSEKDKLLISNVPSYFKVLDENVAIDILYSNLLCEPNLVTEIIVSNDLFSGKHLLELLKENNICLVINCLSANKNYYTEDDLKYMQDILFQFKNLKDLGRIENVKNVLGKTKEKYFCPNGHSNDIGDIFCTAFECGKNIKGITKKQVDQIDDFKIKFESLKALLCA